MRKILATAALATLALGAVAVPASAGGINGSGTLICGGTGSTKTKPGLGSGGGTQASTTSVKATLTSCSGTGDGATVASGSAKGGSSSATTPTSSSPATTSTVIAASTSTAPSTTIAPSTTVAPDPVMPLTGEPITDPALAARPAVVVKVGNYDAHAQRGMNQADIVYEELINASISRFALVFQSHTAKEVGPIRSGRRQDVDLLGSLNKPIFAWAGGNATVTRIIKSSDLVDLSQFKCHGSCYRVTDDVVPYNLVFNVERIYELHLAGAGTPPQQFQYLAVGEQAAGNHAQQHKRGDELAEHVPLALARHRPAPSGSGRRH